MKCKQCTKCKHENVFYCECCQKVKCKDCGEEWGKPSVQIWPYPYPYQPYEPIYPVWIPSVWDDNTTWGEPVTITTSSYKLSYIDQVSFTN